MRTATFYEHSYINNAELKDLGWDEPHLNALNRWADAPANRKYLTVTRKGLRAKGYVGVVQVGGVQIEILPKTDRHEDKTKWRNVLVQMLQTCRRLRLDAPTHAQLRRRNAPLLDYFLCQYVTECEELAHAGLIKKYQTREGNTLALKGKLLFGQHLRHNAVHQERFYTRHTTYTPNHALNQVLATALGRVSALSTALGPRARNLLLDWPAEALPAPAARAAAARLSTADRKTQPYATALMLARLILEAETPDLQGGAQPLFALLFPMNDLFEEYLYHCLRAHIGRTGTGTVRFQAGKKFWLRYSRADILLNINQETYVLDAKWKLHDGKPNPADGYQLFSYTSLHAGPLGVLGVLIYPAPADIKETEYSHSPVNFLPYKENLIQGGMLYASLFKKDDDALKPAHEVGAAVCCCLESYKGQ